MGVPQDGGISCVRAHAVSRDGEIERYTSRRIAAAGRFVGRLVCPCGVEDRWRIEIAGGDHAARVACACRGVALPLYLGAPRSSGPYLLVEGPCGKTCREEESLVGVGIGYPGPLPPVGTVAAERAVEIVLASQCRGCGRLSTPWHLWAPEPPVIRGDEPWMMKIHSLRWKR